MCIEFLGGLGIESFHVGAPLGSLIRSDGGEALADVGELGVGVRAQVQHVKDSLDEKNPRPGDEVKVRIVFHFNFLVTHHTIYIFLPFLAWF